MILNWQASWGAKCFELANMLGREPLELYRAIRNVKDKLLYSYWISVHQNLNVS
jgi:hypothetical protein